jgi:phenylacetate-coenzyme A ligase PaaK-like adenylate-forming protein
MRAPCDISVVAPCYNEAKNIPELVMRLLAVFAKRNISGQIVLVNDGSTDNTGRLIDEYARTHRDVLAVHHTVNRGIEAAWRSGVDAARGEFVCLIDADLQNLPEDVWRLYREIQFTAADMVQGYRSSVGRLKDSRHALSKGLNVILNVLFGMHARDNKSGFVIARREVLLEVLTHRYSYRYFQTFIAVSAKAKGYRIHEIETLFESRLLGNSFMPGFPVKVISLVLLDILKALAEFRFFPKREVILEQFLKTHEPVRRDEPLSRPRRLWLEFFFWTMPFHKWMLTRNTREYYLELKRSQWLTLDEMRTLQELKLRRLIYHAYYNVPYYRQTFDALGLRPYDIRTIEDLRKLPLLSKQDVRDNLYFDLFSSNHQKSRILKVNTSGSTGEPFVCYVDQHQLEIRWAATQRSMEWAGCRFGDRQVRLWHQTLGLSASQVIREKLDAWLNNRLFVPAYEMRDDNLGALLNRIRRHRPVFIDGYAESFHVLARYIRAHGVSGIRPRGIMSSAQILPDHVRQAVEDAFCCQTFDKYGSREFSGIAYECEAHDGHHVVAESYVVEVLKEGRPAQPGEIGEVIITDLNNLCMPFIRYRVGDLAEAMDSGKMCACGRGLPRIGRIEGRVQALIIGANGRYLPGTFFAHVFKDYDYAVRQYQVSQEERGRITLSVIKASRFDQETFDQVLATLRKFMGVDTVIEVTFVDSIPLGRTGKHQGSLSTVDLDFQQVSDQVSSMAGDR